MKRYQRKRELDEKMHSEKEEFLRLKKLYDKWIWDAEKKQSEEIEL